MLQFVDPECDYREGSGRMGHPMQAFCTYSSECARFGSRAALQEAMRAVERQYAVVGVLEDWDVSLAVMERLVPRFFAGAAAIYRGSSRGAAAPSVHAGGVCKGPEGESEVK